MDCNDVHNKLELFLDDDLTYDDFVEFIRHLEKCEECADCYSDERRFKQWMRSTVQRRLPDEAVRSQVREIMARSAAY